jgi:ribokinase
MQLIQKWFVFFDIYKAGFNWQKIILNPSPAMHLPDEVYTLITHLILNETEAEILAGVKLNKLSDTTDAQESSNGELEEVAKIFIRKGVRVVIITLGAAGAYFQSAYNVDHNLPGTHIPGRKANVVDTTAAGDTFAGACAVSLVRQYGVRCVRGEDFEHSAALLAVRFGVLAATKTVEKPGAQSSIPFADELIEEPRQGDSSRPRPIGT